jgi:hypothetical protein
MPFPEAITEEDKKWRAKSDARTLAEAKMIKEDEERLTAATAAAEEMAEEQLKEAVSMKSVAGMYTSMNS